VEEDEPVGALVAVGPPEGEGAQEPLGPDAQLGDVRLDAPRHQRLERAQDLGLVAAAPGLVPVSPGDVLGEQRGQLVEVPLLVGMAEPFGQRNGVRIGHRLSIGYGATAPCGPRFVRPAGANDAVA
jgi:hypothetical protein